MDAQSFQMGLPCLRRLYTLSGLQSITLLTQIEKALVPKTCKPPKTEEGQQLISPYKYCRACQINTTQENDYYESKQDYLCVDCFEKIKINRDMSLQKQRFQTLINYLKETLNDQKKNCLLI
ncbi:unnamed protein product (macronuclear) [Paramecium tetraurelia]|uniref:ZZ-type domain-containing protein n=1 Tax=Paramecium tetraurelia TaxID=5888 RepID=A0BJ61_PARTE|nr:uncharacterized protein GSPATT00004951001 [Paramecium tetraurelia]CAK58578.1 unnamed protein product [Paramecium tetraurelia]|eukprot:XP_001425976.1 hypothetical protein (macronuclear) [Paramecium tetraurelia strain d4-2]